MKRWFAAAAVVCLVVAALAIIVWPQSSPPIGASVAATRPNDSTAGYARADHVRTWTFPEDHGPHPDFQTEWWYFVGNLDGEDGRHFGFELTFFRRAITPTMSTRESDWATNQVYFAHFAISDVKDNRHRSTERFSRGAAGLAGGSGNPFRVWIENWQVSQVPDSEAAVPGQTFRLAAADADSAATSASGQQSGSMALRLTLSSPKPPTLHGDQGLHQKTDAPGNASYYVSFTHLDSQGEVSIDGATYKVHGLSWMDHEFSTAVLGPDDVGWDWYAVQLSDQREVMFYQIRRKDGSVEPLSSGTLVEPDGRTRHISSDQVRIQVLDRWKSPYSGAVYPARWTLAIPSENIQVSISPYMADQEMRVSIVYWEGAVQIAGTSGGAAVTGVGYVELTGYASAFVQ